MKKSTFFSLIAMFVSAAVFLGWISSLCAFVDPKAMRKGRSAPQQSAPSAIQMPASNPNDPRTLSMDEYRFLVALGQNIPNRPVAQRIYVIVERLKISPRLSAEDYDFLIQLGAKLGNSKLSQMIEAVAAQHPPRA